MSESIQFKESVRGIVEYVLKGGSLDDRFVSRRRVLEGTIAHGKLQRDNEKVYQDYEKEVILKHEFLVNNISLIIEGRADGIIKENGKIIIEEIKSTYKDLSYINFDYNLLHWAQGKFYGYIYCVDNNIDEIDIRLSYFNINNDEVRSFDAQAPTGIGKTISTIFPALKSIGENRGEKIVYLTAKTITRTVAQEAYLKLYDKGLKFKVVTITAKEKMCLNNEVKCNLDDCIYAKDYFTKINNVIASLIKKDDKFFEDDIIEYAKMYNICPFQLSLDLSELCDGIICDYNYAFDPTVKLKRIFEERNEKNILLIDEAHNLVSRARNMYSCQIEKSKIVNVNKVIKGKVPRLYKISNAINKEMILIRRELEEINENITYHNEIYQNLIKLMKSFINEAESYLIKAKGTLGYEDVLEFYYSARSFITVSELYSNKYTTILRKEKSEFIIKIFCINPSENLKQTLNGAYSSIIFSATLSPIKYYMDLIGGDEKSFRVRFDSPFNKKNLSTYLYNLDMRYFNREKNIDMLCKLINQFITEVKGNYMVFLPSFEYLGKVYEKYIDIYGNNGTIIQEENLSEEKKKEYLEQFSLKTNIVGFTVVGGMFSEGIDLPGDKLIGAIIVGVGFPKVSIENNIIQDYFEKNGFDYSYTYPGINKVLQSVGRVIRTENDKGRVLLIDNRYSSYKYKAMLPSEWDIKNYKLLN